MKKYDARTIKAVIRQLNKMADKISESIERQKDAERAKDPKAKWSTFLIVLCGQSTILRREACEMLEKFTKRYAL
jgi:predicted transcriptional regulator